MLELKLGFMTDEEIAEWCGKTVVTFKRNRKRWCTNILSKYAKFEIVNKGINIIEIKDPIFLSSGRKEVAEKWRDCWGYDNSSIDTNSACWSKLKSQMINNLSDSTGRSYISNFKCEEYGVAYKRRKRDGTKGYCHFVFCKIVDGIPQHFTDEELKIKKELEDKHLTNSQQQQYDMQALLAALRLGEITNTEYQEAITELIETDTGWSAFQEALEEAIGYPVDFRTELVDDAIKHHMLEPDYKVDKPFEF